MYEVQFKAAVTDTNFGNKIGKQIFNYKYFIVRIIYLIYLMVKCSVRPRIKNS